MRRSPTWAFPLPGCRSQDARNRGRGAACSGLSATRSVPWRRGGAGTWCTRCSHATGCRDRGRARHASPRREVALIDPDTGCATCDGNGNALGDVSPRRGKSGRCRHGGDRSRVAAQSAAHHGSVSRTPASSASRASRSAFVRAMSPSASGRLAKLTRDVHRRANASAATRAPSLPV